MEQGKMSKITAVFTDLDGTVLRNDKSISQRTMDAIQRFREQGGIWAVATARPEIAIKRYKELLEADALITLNGARIKIGNNVVSNGFSAENAHHLLSELLQKKDLMIVLETSKGIFANMEIPEWNAPNTPDLLALLSTCDIYKILLAGRDHRLFSITEPTEHLCESALIPDRIRNTIKTNNLSEDAYFTVAEGWLYQIMSKKATKWNGVRMVLEEKGILPENAMYFGDDHDDVESIRYIGQGVAMGNAIEEVKKVAKMITATNEEDGVAQILESPHRYFA